MLLAAVTVVSEVDRVAQLQFLSTLGWGFCFALAAVVWFLAGLVDHGCPSCPHCRRRTADQDVEARERLFGRQVVRPDEEEAPHDEGASRGDERDD